MNILPKQKQFLAAQLKYVVKKKVFIGKRGIGEETGQLIIQGEGSL